MLKQQVTTIVLALACSLASAGGGYVGPAFGYEPTDFVTALTSSISGALSPALGLGFAVFLLVWSVSTIQNIVAGRAKQRARAARQAQRAAYLARRRGAA